MPSRILVSGQISSSGDNELIAAPGAGKRLVIHEFHIVNEDSSAVTVLVRQADKTSEAFRAHLAAAGDAFSWEDKGNFDDEWHLDLNTALEANLDGAIAVGYTIRYNIQPY